MPRILEKKERRLGVKLAIKGERALSPKSATVRRPYPPGQHGKGRQRKMSEFGLQLKEKQKIKFTYALTEKQMKHVFEQAEAQHGAVSHILLEILESRLDSVVFHLGLAEGRAIARQLVSHGHFFVNGKRVRTRSFIVRPGDTITVRPESKDIPQFRDAKERLKSATTPVWLSLNLETLEAKLNSKPRDIEVTFDINLVVDYYSR